MSREFIVEVIKYRDDGQPLFNVPMHISHIFKEKTKIKFYATHISQHSKIWNYKKSCEKTIEKIKNQSTKLYPSEFNIIEITDQKTLRKLKLKKLKYK